MTLNRKKTLRILDKPFYLKYLLNKIAVMLKNRLILGIKSATISRTVKIGFDGNCGSKPPSSPKTGWPSAMGDRQQGFFRVIDKTVGAMIFLTAELPTKS